MMRASGVSPTENGFSHGEQQRDGNGSASTESSSSSRLSKSRNAELRYPSAASWKRLTNLSRSAAQCHSKAPDKG